MLSRVAARGSAGDAAAREMDDQKMYHDKRDLLVRAGFRPSRIRLRYHKFGLNLFALVLFFWRPGLLTGFAISGALVIVVSVAMVGPAGMRSYTACCSNGWTKASDADCARIWAEIRRSAALRSGESSDSSRRPGSARA